MLEDPLKDTITPEIAHNPQIASDLIKGTKTATGTNINPNAAKQAGLDGNITPEALMASRALQHQGIVSAVQNHAIAISGAGFWGKLGHDVGDIAGKVGNAVKNDVAGDIHNMTHDAAIVGEAALDAGQVAWNNAIKPVGTTALNIMNTGLKTAQSDYKFIHAVWHDHGVAQGLLAGLPMAGGAVAGGIAGFFLGGPAGVVLGAGLGADLGGYAEKEIAGNTIYPDSFKKSLDPKYEISAGRDITNALGNIADGLGAESLGNDLLAKGTPGKNTKNTSPFRFLGTAISGIADTTLDFTTDPTIIGGKVSAGIRAGKFLVAEAPTAIKVVNEFIDGVKAADYLPKGQLANEILPQVNSPISSYSTGIKESVNKWLSVRSQVPTTANQLDAIAEDATNKLNTNARDYLRAREGIVAINKAAQSKASAMAKIILDYKVTPTQANRLSEAVNVDQVHEILRNGYEFADEAKAMGNSFKIPSTGLLRAKIVNPVQALLRGDKVSTADLGWLRNGYATLSTYRPWDISTNESMLRSTNSFHYKSARAAQNVYSMLRGVGISHSFASETTGQFIQKTIANDHEGANMVMRNAFKNVVKSLGLPANHSIATKFYEEIDKLFPEVDKGENLGGNVFGDANGTYTKVDGTPGFEGTSSHQIDKSISLPNMQELKDNIHRLGYLAKYESGNQKYLIKPENIDHNNPFGPAVSTAGLFGSADKMGAIQKFFGQTGELGYGVGKAINRRAIKPIIDLIFKPLAILKGGWAIKVAASEMLNNVAREGVLPVMRSYATAASLTLSYGKKLTEAEVESEIAAHTTILGAAEGISSNPLKTGFPTFSAKIKDGLSDSLAKIVGKRQMELASEWTEMNGGRLLNHAVATGLSSPEDYGVAANKLFEDQMSKTSSTEEVNIKEKLLNKVKNTASSTKEHIERFSNKDNKLYQGISKESPSVIPQFVTSLNKEARNVAGQFIAKDLAKAIDDYEKETGTTLDKLTFRKPSDIAITKFWTKKIDNAIKNNVKESTTLKDFNSHYETEYKELADAQKHLEIINNHWNDPAVLKSLEISEGIRQRMAKLENQRVTDTNAGTGPYSTESKDSARWKDQDPKAMSEDRVNARLGLFIGQDGTIFKPIINNVANGKNTTIQDLLKINKNSFPVNLPGRESLPIIPSRGLSGFLSRAINGSFEAILDPLINVISRQPIALRHYAFQRTLLDPMVEKGLLRPDQAARIARTRAVAAMIPEIHAPWIKSEFSHATNSIMPFYFAQEQAIKRAFRAAYDTRSSIPVFGPLFSTYTRQYMMIEQAMNNPNFVTTDANGNKMVNLPGASLLGNITQDIARDFGLDLLDNLPVMGQGNMSSLKTVLPGLNAPGLSPVGVYPLKQIANLFPAISIPIDKALGAGANQGFVNSLIPNSSFINVWDSLGIQEQNSALLNATISALETAYVNGQAPGPNADPTLWKLFVNQVQNNARSILFLKGVVGMLSPLSPTVKIEDTELSNEFKDLLKPKNQGGEGLAYPDAVHKFLGLYGDKSVAITASKTEKVDSTFGSSLQLTKPAMDFVIEQKKPGGFFAKGSQVSRGAAYLIPQTANVSYQSGSSVYQQALTNDLIRVRTPLELLNQIFVDQGYADYELINKPLVDAKAKDEIVLPTGAVVKTNTYDLQNITDTYNKNLQSLSVSNPVWYDEFKAGTNKNNAPVVVSQLNVIFNDPKLIPNNEQTKIVKVVLDKYNAYATLIAGYKANHEPAILTTMAKNDWKTYLNAEKVSQPLLAPVINSVFSKL